MQAFIKLIARHGLEAVTIDGVATAAGVSRTAVRHFVGNRSDLVAEAVATLVQRYKTMIRSALGEAPDAHDLVVLLFSDAWVRERPIEDQAFGVLQHEAMRDNAKRPLIRAAFDTLVDELVAAFRRSGSQATTAQLTDVAYQIVCLSEQNVVLQTLGFPRARSRAAATHARSIADQLMVP